MRIQIKVALARLEAQHGIRILYACESGSRAWGYPSPDSDYDVRFIYAHPAEWYLRLDEGPDTLNFPVDDDLDLAGWELRKALRLLRGSNSALFEWLQSPIIYQEAPGFRAQLAPLLPQAFNLKASQYHYMGQLRRSLAEDLPGDTVRLKRLFYALRAALAARWLRERHTLPPMEFGPLRELLPDDLQGVVQEMMAQKAGANDRTLVLRPAALIDFLAAEHAAGLVARELLPLARGTVEPLTQALDALLRAWLPA